MKNIRSNYWNNFYSKKTSLDKINFPSQFSMFTLSNDIKKNLLIEFGCGNGRDAHYMSKYYKRVICYDSSNFVIKNNINKFKDIKNLKFVNHDIIKKNDLNFLKKYKKTIYARFFIHSLKNDEIDIFIKILSFLLKKNEKIFLEYRTDLDKKTKKTFKKHFRNYLDPKKIINLFKKENIENIYSNTSYGYALFGNEDPHIARQIFVKK